MNDNQSLVVHSRWVYNFMGIILEAQVSFIFSFMYSFQKLVSDFGDLETLCIRRDSYRESTACKWVYMRWIEAFIANLGHPLWGSAVNAGINTWN